MHWLGRRRGGTGTLNEVAYSFALFWAPLSVIFAVLTLLLAITLVGIILLPLVGLPALAVNVYFGYLAVQASMNLPGGGTTWTLTSSRIILHCPRTLVETMHFSASPWLAKDATQVQRAVKVHGA